jgi:protein-tyrosine phosphatase
MGWPVKAFFVTKRLAFGSMITTWSDVERLQHLGITHVINLLRNKNTKKIRQFKWLWLPFTDDKKPRPRWFYRKALKFHKRATRKRDSKVFVMCHHGISRSASMAYFLLCASGLGSDKAESTILRVRPCAHIVRAYRESGEKFLSSRSAVINSKRIESLT